MGQGHSNSNADQKRSNVKLQAQSIGTFDGKSIKWHSWKARARAAMGIAGMLDILDKPDYAKKNGIDNETVFHMLQVATVDGSASHLVDQYSDINDGHKAFQALLNWYEGDKLTSDTAEDVRSKLEKISLSTRYPASDYINDFQQYNKLLVQLGEEYSRSHTTTIFLRQITDPEFQLTVQLCIENKLSLKDCIDRVRARERILSRDKTMSKKSYVNLRRDNVVTDVGNAKELNIEDFKNERGFYSVPGDIWRKLSDDDQNQVRKHNGALRRKRERDDKLTSSLTTRRAISDSESPEKKPKTVQFLDSARKSDESKSQDDDQGEITNRREVIRFRMGPK